ncbi:MAG TPA: adenylate/guanylate cyclase domain-containing protein [Alphaproteobacteria bacterium]|nr:adenylate/guanylate cyclase domain-containing protein [Alphaproteobacteria bacterium]
MKRRLAAVLALDTVGYSRLMGADEEGTHARVMSALRGVAEPRIRDCDGRIIKHTGDGLLVEFASVVEAVRCAVAIQREMRARGSGDEPGRRVDFRIGINVGDVLVEPDEIYGDGVNIAVRLESLAEPGGICVSHVVADQIEGKIEIEFVDAGEQALKNIARPVRVLHVKLPDGGAVPLAARGAGAAIPSTVPGFRGRPAIAVLPFANMSGDPEQEYFADGLTEDIITALAGWRSFPVIARNSVFTYKGRNVDIRTVGRELGAQYVLEGSVRRQANRFRITGQLIEAETNLHVFADRYDREITDVFAVQDEITTSIVGALEPELLRVESDRAASAPQLFSAYDYLQRGLWHHYRYTAEDNVSAQDYFRKALELDPSYSQAAAALSVTLIHSMVHRWQKENRAIYDEAIAFSKRAVSLDPRSPHARYALALSYFHTGEIFVAIREMEEVIRLHPSHAVARANLGNLYNYVNQPDRAREAVLLALRLSPNDPRKFIWMPALAGSLYLLSRYEESIEAGRQGHSMKPDYVASLRYVAASLGQLGRASEAAPYVEILRRSDVDISSLRSYLARYYVDTAALEHIIDGLRKAGFT